MSRRGKKVGNYTDIFNQILGLDLPCLDIFQSDGLIKHIQNRHPSCVRYMESIQEIILYPDYVGSNPNEPNSIELIKIYSENIQIAVKLDISENYFYVASLYDISDKKIENRLHSGRIKKVIK